MQALGKRLSLPPNCVDPTVSHGTLLLLRRLLRRLLHDRLCHVLRHDDRTAACATSHAARAHDSASAHDGASSHAARVSSLCLGSRASLGTERHGAARGVGTVAAAGDDVLVDAQIAASLA